MWSWINLCIGFVAAHPGWALTLAFAGAIIEAVAVIGILVPGTPLLMAVTGAAAMAGQPMAPFLALAIIGAVIGDFMSYWMGYRHRAWLRAGWPFASRPHLLAKADRFFHRYGTASVALCRFVPVFRSTVPLVAGMTGMERRRFLLANITSAFVWAPAHVYPAQFAGMSIERLREGDWQTAALWAAALGVCTAAGWVLHRVVVSRVE
jgi:membrane protein DedA with SNARE-associated domain